LSVALAVLTVTGILYLLISIAFSVFEKRKVRLRGSRIQGENLEEVLRCQADVERLFHEVVDHTFDLQARASRQPLDLAQQWEMFWQRWRDDWSEVGERCRFVELRDRGLGTAFDRLAYAHEALEQTGLKFATFLRNYIDNQVPHIEEIRRGLEASRRGLEAQRKPGAPTRARAP
jgi:hypothetical protein